jgi:CRISPR-associated endonuclease Cas2
MTRLGNTQKKILILLLGGVALGFTQSPKQYFRIVGIMIDEWKWISKPHLERSIQKLYESKLVAMKRQKDGSWTIALTKEGRRKTLLYDFETLTLKKPLRWDAKWRIVIFDIPEEKVKARNAFRSWLNRLEFHRLQNSVFVHPYDCRKEFDFLVEFYQLQEYTHFIEATSIDNEVYLKQVFVKKSIL